MSRKFLELLRSFGCLAPATRADPDVGYVLIFFLTSRIWLEAIGVLSRSLIRPHLDFEFVWVYSTNPWLGIWGVWDTGWFLEIARHGYDAAIRTSGDGIGQANWAMFPAYPMTSATLASITGLPVFVVMVAVSNIAFLAALILIRMETENEFGRAAARATVAILCVMPASYVFSSAYSESLFLLAVVMTLMLMRRRLWLAAGFAAGLATLTRNTGIGLVLPMLLVGGRDVLAASMAERNLPGLVADSFRRAWRVVLACSIPACALVGFCIFLYLHTGDPLAFASIQKHFGKTLQYPFMVLLRPIFAPGSLEAREVLNWVSACIAIAMLVQLAVWKRWHLLAFGIFLVVLPLCSGTTSYLRYLTTMLPIVMAGGALCARNSVAQLVVLSTLAAINGFMMVGWALGFTFVW